VLDLTSSEKAYENVDGFAKRAGRKKGTAPPRGLDFYLKWSIGNWAEEIVYKFCREILSKELNVQAYRYGYSAGRIPESLKEFEEIQEERRRLESFGKRPNFLLFDADFARAKDQELSQLMRRPDEEVKDLVREAVLGLEVEQSMWFAKRAKKPLSFTVKEEDVEPLRSWQKRFEVPIVIFQVFLDQVHACPLDEVVSGKRPRRDPTTKKPTYFHSISKSTHLADIEGLDLRAKVEVDDKGKLVPFIMLVGGDLVDVNLEGIMRLRAYFKRKT